MAKRFQCLSLLFVYCLQRIRFSETRKCVKNQAVMCELEPTWPRDSNVGAYCCQLSTTCQILGDSQCIANYTAICELDTM